MGVEKYDEGSNQNFENDHKYSIGALAGRALLPERVICLFHDVQADTLYMVNAAFVDETVFFFFGSFMKQQGIAVVTLLFVIMIV